MPAQNHLKRTSAEQIRRHIKTHSERESDDIAAVTVLESFLLSGGKITTHFAVNDKWPNVDGDFELVPNPENSRQPQKRFAVQIKGTSVAHIAKDGKVHYQLKDLGFLAYVATEITMDPSILFLVLNPESRNQRRVFWKYISDSFLASVDFNHDSTTIIFGTEDEIENTDEAVDAFVKKLDAIADTHSFVKQLESREYSKEDIIKLVRTRCDNISETIITGVEFGQTREQISRRLLTQLEDVCVGTLILNGLLWYTNVNLRTAWELAIMSVDTQFLAAFLQGLRYIGLRVPEDGQNERLMLKYYGFLWRIRKYLNDYHGLFVLENLEAFPQKPNEEDEEYNKLLAQAIDSACHQRATPGLTRYYVQKKTAFYIQSERYFEITLQLADMFATKYNRLTVYSKLDISTNYSIQVGYVQADIILFDRPTKIKVITDWRVSIAPAVLNKLSKIVRCNTRISANYNEYGAIMDVLTRTGANLLDIIDFRDEMFRAVLEKIYSDVKTDHYAATLTTLHERFGEKSTTFGRYTVRYALISLREELLEDLLPKDVIGALNSSYVYLSKKCYSFELNPILYNLPRHKTNRTSVSHDILRAIGIGRFARYLPYIRSKSLTDTTGELFHPKEEVENSENAQTIEAYNSSLTEWDKKQRQTIKELDGYVYIDEYVENTVSILKYLLKASSSGNVGQKQLNKAFISGFDYSGVDEIKLTALETVFTRSCVAMIYGAAGTGKTTLMNFISNLMDGRRKLFLTKTYTALDNLRRRIQSPGANSRFMGIDQFVNTKAFSDFDVIFVDECSTIDNRTMMLLLQKINSSALLVLAGDIYQIESIDFGNWFFYAKSVLPAHSIIELTGTWRTQEETIKRLWEEVRFMRPLITEMLVIDGPFSKNIGKELLERFDDDEVVLCLNYDGKFGLNSINSYFQDANPSTETYYWSDWKYKIGDPVLFNESRRFPMLYNNLKGTIVDIQKESGSLFFTIDIPIVLTALDVRDSDLEIVSLTDNSTKIRFGVFENDEKITGEDDEDARIRSIVPFQLAYAVSIHKAQGLEYNSIKVVIPNSNSERITHGIFYTAITRTKEKLKIYWSADTMAEVIGGFVEESRNDRSLDMLKPFLN